MKFNEFMEGFANEIGGQFQEYDTNKSVIIIPLEGGRFQAVLGHMKYSEKYRKTGIEFTSKVCEFDKEVNPIELLEENSNFCHAKFVLVDGFVKVEASAFIDFITEELLKEIIVEVANTADEWEYRLTGQDVH
jgi:hypothetical protein